MRELVAELSSRSTAPGSGVNATIPWRYRFGEGDENSVRGVNLIHVRQGRIVEAFGYVKAGLRQ